MSEFQSAPKRLPIKPSEEHLRKQAKRRVKLDPTLQLADVQQTIAREYGCKNWADLILLVESTNREAAQLVGVTDELDLALWQLCKSSDNDAERIARATMLIDQGAAVRRAFEDQSTALHQAAAHGPLEIVELLLRAGAKEWQPDKDGKKPVEYARTGVAADKDAIVELLDRPVIRDPVFKSAVKAIHAGDLATLESILRDHPNLVHQRAMEPDCYPPSYFSNPKLLWFIANNPTLMETMPTNIVEIGKSIIDAGATMDDINGTLELVMTSSKAREQSLQIPLMKLLLSRGAKPGDLLAVLAHWELEPVKVLLESGVPMTATIAAALGRNDELLKVLRDANAATTQTAFGIAVINRQHAAARLCLEAGADVNAFLPVHSHSLPIHQAAVNDDVEMLQLLVEYGTRLDVRDTLWNATPLDWAIHTGKQAAEKYVRSVGAS
jgi:peptide-methionine (S)-S-oxide reductase